eukprot:TRINITY_DN1730_c0_g1_i1.p1 TRINITY_DN1730_c0_g1~~TRINITY_DN1730_c0_g1_i1.p1  ORF type:complete len:448 (+),score=142.13 TRINITY_DN1730_c0_g1_i1:146-1489(+)
MCIRDRYQRRVRGFPFANMKLTALLFALGASLTYADNWAVIVAGSSGFMNYRHQADACHAYQIMKKNGVPESNIILLLADDVANNEENPFKGKLYNKPTAAGTPGVDVYEGCKPTYTGADKLTPKLFLDVIQGKKSATAHTVLKSTAKDNVFINFADHGGVGIIAMPSGGLVSNTDLVSALKSMHSSKMYSKLVFYMEACESGSMFKTLPSGLNIYATTAANAQESSWGTYCSPNDMVNGKHVGSCLGDLYSVNWMEDSDDSSEMASESLEKQFTLVKKETNKSHCMEFGDVDALSSLPIHDFQAAPSNLREINGSSPKGSGKLESAVDSRDIALVTRFQNYLLGGSPEQAQALMAEITMREQMKARFSQIASIAAGSEKVTHMMTTPADLNSDAEWDCHHTALTAVTSACGQFNDYSMKFTTTVANLCKAGVVPSQIQMAAQTVCK